MAKVNLRNPCCLQRSITRIAAWLKRLRGVEVCRADLARARAYVADIASHNLERRKIFWRGDRIEWLLAQGYHDWFMAEIAAGRVNWPGLGVPHG